MINELHGNIQEQMRTAIDHVRSEMANLRTGRANPRMVDQIKVDYYGSLQALKTLANINVPEPRLLVIEPFDKTQMKAIERAIMTADIGITPNNDGNVIRLPLPELTEERRKEMVKLAHGLAEEGKVSIRNARRDGNNELKKLEGTHDISEDNLHRAMDNFQELTDKCIKEIDDLMTTKQAEILND